MPNFKKNIDEIKNLIAKNEISIAIEDLGALLDQMVSNLRKEKSKRYEKNYLKLSSDHNSLLKKEQDNATNYDSLKIMTNKVIFNLISLLHNLENEVSELEKTPLDGLIRIDPKDAMELAINELDSAQSMKVIGIARQNFVEVSDNNQHVLNYYRKIEDKLTSKTTSGKPFYIKRVTQHVLKNKFKNHLRKCYEAIVDSNNQYEIVLYGDLKITYTYYIINSDENDESILFLSLNTKDSNIELVDNTLAFYTRNKSIIHKFNLHFDQFWNNDGQKGRVIKNLSDFEKYVPFDKKIYQKYNEIKNFIKRVPNDSVRVKHLRHEINTFHRRLENLDKCVMVYTHSNKNQRISDCFSDYIEDMRDGNKTYKTISVKGFWETLYDVQGFLEKQEISLHKGAEIHRIYLVDSNIINSQDDSRAEQIAILRNYLQHMKYDNYTFHILFSTDEREITRRENYAIWANNDIEYKVLFLIRYGTSPNATTELTFSNFSNLNDAKMHENQVKLNDYEFRLNQAIKRVIEQNTNLLNYLQDKKETNLDITDEVLEQRLDFLRRNGIIEIENFLKTKKTVQNYS